MPSPASRPTDRPAARPDHRPRIGALGERLARRHLERRGFAILEHGLRTRWGEIDLIAHDGRTLVFCEVKTRRATTAEVAPWTSLHERKQQQVRRLASAWLATERRDRPPAEEVRFDAIAVLVDERDRLLRLDHLEGAF
ncbi:YraN family protein [Patulibacter defluvii]|uniref:YraN family protein n=1 Tax=Patulibacter defluvii TaxID=3095358 RepID=UPI002A76612A|nr:YraN family protein [Patulibacter sp. DM4]